MAIAISMNSIIQRIHNAFDLITPSLILIVPLVSFLQYNNFNFLSYAVMALIFGLVGIGLICGLMGKLGGRWVTALIYALLLTLFLDLQFESLPFINKRQFANEFVAIGFIFSFSVAYLAGRRISLILGAGFATIICVAAVLPVESRPEQLVVNKQPLTEMNKGRHKLPLILHLVLDAHIGLEGLPPEIPEAQAFKKKLKSFYLKNGFKIYGSAYSQYFDTGGSLSQVFNLHIGDYSQSRNAGQLEYLRKLEEKGYRINTYGTYSINHCSDTRINYASCYFYDALSISHVNSLNLKTSEQLIVLVKSFLYRSLIYQKLFAEVEKLRKGHSWIARMVPHVDWEMNVRTQPVTSMHAINALSSALHQAKHGDMFLAHLLLPHAPYIYSNDCKAKGLNEWYNRVPLTGVNTHETRQKFYLSYIQQALCTLAKVQEIFEILAQRNLLDEAIIIVHGDHGSRINLVEPSTRNISNPMSNSDLRDGFSTIAAIKIPGGAPKYEIGPIAISKLLHDFEADNFLILPKPNTDSLNETIYMNAIDTGEMLAIKRNFLGAER